MCEFLPQYIHYFSQTLEWAKCLEFALVSAVVQEHFVRPLRLKLVRSQLTLLPLEVVEAELVVVVMRMTVVFS